MIPMKNGRLSSGEQTKHVDIRYFYVKDLKDRGIVSLSHCVSEEMLGAFYTKLIQGRRLLILRDIILNIDSTVEHRSMLVNSENRDAQLRESSQARETVSVIA
jgi:sporulation protein YlmC with PRC-barrel domain